MKAERVPSVKEILLGPWPGNVDAIFEMWLPDKGHKLFLVKKP